MSTAVDLTNRISGYNLGEQLYCGSRTLVYRAIRETDQHPVVIKLLNRDYPSFSELLQFRNQYTIAKNLPLHGVVEPYNLESYRHSYALVMEDFGGISLRDYAQERSLTLAEILAIALQLTDILNELYRHRVIHKDIKPANVLIHPETKQVKLIDFSIASLLPRETQEIQNPNVLEGTLAYISPEQTGRMNRGIDYRTDFYSLGVTFYELLTGQLPFECDDPMELVHCHIAKQPPSINSQEIPQVVSDMVMKLMAKNAENRYQSALGLKHDLEICLAQLQETGNIETFVLGTRDITDRFLIPEKLYGRETEVANLLAAFERVSAGNTEMMLVAGFSGIGKTAVVNEVHKPIVRQRGYFIKGKYDQFQRNIPFSAFVQAFRDLMGQLLSESDADLEMWKTKILSAVGDNGQVLIEVIPELERIMGVQPPAPELSGSAAQNRFNLLMQKFVQVFTTVEHPLVIFLDDLQWADGASLKLLQLLMEDTGHLLVLGAYRDNEVSPVHPFILTVDEIVKAGATVNTITLQPLGLADMNQLVAHTLICDRSLAQPLTELVYQKTQGNPFFATQFLKALHDDGWITFNPPQSPLAKGGSQGGWQCDIAQVRALAITDDVVEFMALQLQKLPIATQSGLKLAACIGAQFDLATLAIVSEKSLEETAADLWKALQEGLLVPTTEIYKFFTQSDEIATVNPTAANANYKFLHDRVQQAAYSLIPDRQKQSTHLKIGQLLRQNSSEIEQEEKLFDIVEHFNLGQELITQPKERQVLAELNLKAGQKARNAIAYSAAKSYLQTGIDLLTENCWQNQYELTLSLYVKATETAYLNAEFDSMEKLGTEVLQKAQTILDKVKIYEVQIAVKIAQSQMLESLVIGKNALKQLGVELPNEANQVEIDKALQNLAKQLESKQIPELIDLSVMSDPQTQAAIRMLGILFGPIFQGMPSLLPLVSSQMVSLSLEFGNAPASSVGYVLHGMVMSAFLGDVETGYKFGKLAINLLDRFPTKEYQSIVFLLFGCFIQHHQETITTMITTLKNGYTVGMETGDFLYAGYNIVNCVHAKFFSGLEINTLADEVANYSAIMAKLKQHSAQAYLDRDQEIIHNLLEVVSQPDCFIGSRYDERVMIPKHHQDHEITALAEIYIFKLILSYTFGNYPTALNYISQASLYLMALPGMILVPVFHFYSALTYLAVFPTQSELEQSQTLEQVKNHQTNLQQWAQNTPMNYLHKWYLVEAEKYRVLGNKLEAIEHYDLAIQLAQDNQFINEEALALELAAKFYLDWGKEKVACSYMTEAYYCYAGWGVKAKIKDLEKRYPKLLSPLLKQSQINIDVDNTIVSFSSKTIISSETNISSTLDLATVLKASQALSNEIQLEELLSTLMQVLMENAGADKCTLILVKGNNLTIVGTAGTKEANTKIQLTLQPAIPLESSPDVPVSVINYVSRTKEILLIDDKTVQISLLSDSYFQQQQPQSLLCTPIINQGKLIGILYLENHLTPGVFTRDRLQTIKLLTTQAAISLENAQLYHQLEEYSHTLEEKVEERTQEITEKATQLESTLAKLYSTQSQLIQAEKMSGLGQLVAGIAHEINNPINFIYGNLQPANEYIMSLIELNNLYQQFYPQPFPEIAQKNADIDLEFLVDDLPKLLLSMKVGADRIRQIVLSLRNFSRLDEAEAKPVDIHSGIDSTLLILQHRLNNNRQNREIAIIKKYGQLPLVNCYASALNQVFMNILSNAIDVLEESASNQHPSITIQTKIQAPKVMICITDNGIGISESIRNKIFEPFFTTKSVGSGTGLGLSISYSIVVEKHRGKLSCISTPGEGTEFVIEIPV